MTEKQTQSFRDWLRDQVTRVDSVGAFAREWASNPSLPTFPLDQYVYLRERIEAPGAWSGYRRSYTEWAVWKGNATPFESLEVLSTSIAFTGEPHREASPPPSAKRSTDD